MPSFSLQSMATELSCVSSSSDSVETQIESSFSVSEDILNLGSFPLGGAFLPCIFFPAINQEIRNSSFVFFFYFGIIIHIKTSFSKYLISSLKLLLTGRNLKQLVAQLECLKVQNFFLSLLKYNQNS